MKNREILHSFICIALLTLFLGVAFLNVDKSQNPTERTDTGLIKRSPTGQFTRGGTSTFTPQARKKKTYSRVIYIGEPTTGLLDFWFKNFL